MGQHQFHHGMEQQHHSSGTGRQQYHSPGADQQYHHDMDNRYHDPGMDHHASLDDYQKTPGTVVREHRPSALDRLRDRFPFLYSKKGIAIVVGVLLLLIGGGLAGLAALPREGDSSDNERPIADDSFFYGLSPPTYPSRKSTNLQQVHH